MATKTISALLILVCFCSLTSGRAGAQSQTDAGGLLQGLLGPTGPGSSGPSEALLGLSKSAQLAGGGQTPEDCRGSMMGRMLDMLFYDLQGLAGRSDVSGYLPQLDAIKPLARQFLTMSQGSYCETRTALLLFAMIATLERRLGEAEAIYDKVLPPLEPDTGKVGALELFSYASVASNRFFQNRFDEAEELLSQLLPRFERQFGESHQGTIALIGALGDAKVRLGRFSEAQALFEREFGLSRKYLGEAHPLTCVSPVAIGYAHLRQGELEEAEGALSAALASETAACHPVFTPQHPWTARTRYYLGLTYKAMGDDAKAESLLSSALDIALSALGESHPQTIRIMLAMAEVLALQGRLDDAVVMLNRMDGAFLPWLLGEVHTTRAHGVRRHLVGSQSRFQQLALLIALRDQGSQLAQDAAGAAILRYKGLQGEEEAALARLLRAEAVSADVRSLAHEVAHRRSVLALLYHRSSAEGEAVQREQIEGLVAQLAEAEFELARQSGLFERQLRERGVGLAEVQTALRERNDRAVLVEFRRYRHRDLRTVATGVEPDRWAAVVIDAERTRTADLGAGSAIDPLIAAISSPEAVKNEATSEQDLQENVAGCDPNAGGLAAVQAALYQCLIAKLDLAGYDTVFLVPDGALHLVPFEALRRQDGTHWIADASQSIRQLQNGRALAQEHVPPDRQGLVVFGGIDYGTMPKTAPPTTRQAEAQPNAPAELFELAQKLIDGDRLEAPHATDTRSPGATPAKPAIVFAELPGTKHEGEAISVLYSRVRDKERTELLLGKDATEARLKSLPEPPRVLHLATHGFFRAATLPTDRLMLLSGVALAGANAGLSDDGEDGILYAIEAQNLNLEGTELVALSACETAQGVIERGEGVYGLVRALRTAGASHALVALRPIPDLDAYQFMKQFYNNWLLTEKDLPRALEKTKRHFANHDGSIDWTPYVLISNKVTR